MRLLQKQCHLKRIERTEVQLVTAKTKIHPNFVSAPPTTLKGTTETYTAQCNGVKGFPSRYANGLCSSNSSRQSSCPRKDIEEEREKRSEHHLSSLNY